LRVEPETGWKKISKKSEKSVDPRFQPDKVITVASATAAEKSLKTLLTAAANWLS